MSQHGIFADELARLEREKAELEARLGRAETERDEESEKANYWMARHRDVCEQFAAFQALYGSAASTQERKPRTTTRKFPVVQEEQDE